MFWSIGSMQIHESPHFEVGVCLPKLLQEHVEELMSPKYAPPQINGWNLKMMVSKRNLLFQGSVFRFQFIFFVVYTNLSGNFVDMKFKWELGKAGSFFSPDFLSLHCLEYYRLSLRRFF